jgi:MOSC domain-containing protein YiiM
LVDDHGERAVLVQTTANLRAIAQYASRSPPKKPLRTPSSGRQWGDASEDWHEAAGDWGENVLLEGGTAFGSSSLCIGDVLEFRRGGAAGVEAGARPLVLRLVITSPRLPCVAVDLKHGSTYSKMGLRAETARTGLAGIFARVNLEGTVQGGDHVTLAHRPHPEWPLERAAQLLYGNETAVMKYASRGVLLEEWGGSHEEARPALTLLLSLSA